MKFRLRCIATETYKCINNMSLEYLRDLVEVKQTKYSFRYEYTVKIPTVKTVTYGQRSFRFKSARVWNSLPNELSTATSFREFKGLIRTWVGPRCNCAMCGSWEGQVSKLCCFNAMFYVTLFMLCFLTVCIWFYCMTSCFIFSWCRPLVRTVGSTFLSLFGP